MFTPGKKIMINEKNKIVKTKKYDVYSVEKGLVDGHIVFVPKQESWKSLCSCFEAAYKWGYDWVEKGYCKSFHVLQNVGEHAGNANGNLVYLIPRQESDKIDLDRIKEFFNFV